MKRNLASLTGLLLASVAVAPALAQDATSASMADRAFAAWDADRNGVLSQAEFQAGWRNMAERSAAARLRAQFDKLDRNNDGGLDRSEYANLALVLQAGKEAPGLEAFDANGDKRLQFDEYVSSVDALAAANRKARTQP